MTSDPSHLRRLKEKLPHTWDALFARFGRFTDIQSQAIKPLLEGRNCVLVSATASGKTEAALAPLLERHKKSSSSKSQNKLSILYIVPTRALARDLARRLKQPLEKLAVRMQVKTGDEPALNPRRPPELLLTTPESFDSLLANHPRMAKDISAVVIDELHIFDQSVRGDQLRILLNRLRRIRRYALERGDITASELQFCALSATISDPGVVAARYFTDPFVTEAAGQRAVDAELIALNRPETLIQFFATLKERGVRKALAFCTRRAECEEWAHLLRHGSPFGNHVYVHHASLEARVRRSVESRFGHADAALCFATSTLELGIDIGDVDLVFLVGPPDSTSAFLQRIGRGNRRTSRTAVICLYRNAMERALFQVFIRTAQSGKIEPLVSPRFRPSVVVQQLCSYIKQTRLGEIDPDQAYELFVTPPGEPLIEKRSYNQIIEHLLIKQYFVPARGRALKPGPLWQELYEERAIYTNLPDPWRGTIDVIDEMTGRKLGEVERGVAPGATFLFDGQARRVTRRIGRKMFVREADEALADAPQLRTPWRPLSYALAQAVAIQLGLPCAGSPAELAMIPDEEPGEANADAAGTPGSSLIPPSAWVFHCAGDAWGVVLGDLLEATYRVKVEDCSDLYLMVRGALPDEPLRFSAEQVFSSLRRRWQQFEGWFDLGRFQSQLPREVRRASVIETFDVTGFLRSLSGRKITRVR
jgi:ATP-dependent Lhr-like helicase